MKYIVNIPSELVLKDDGYSFSDGNSYCITGNLSKLTPYAEPDRKAIEDEVWEFVKEIECLTRGEAEDCFDVEYDGIPFVANMFSYQEAKAKYKAWRTDKEQIHVGDEVENASHKKGIVLNHYISPNNGLEYVRVLYMDDDGNSFISAWEKNGVNKTGRHFDSVEKLLEEMRED